MKKFSVLILSCALLFAACNNSKTGGMSDQAQKNLDAFHTVTKAIATGDPTLIDSVVSPDFVDHTDRGDMGRDSLKAMISSMSSMATDLKFETVKELADDEWVMGWMKYTGNSTGVGMPAGPFTMNTLEVVKFKDGKCIEHWAFMESQEMMKMMQNMQGPMPPADTAKKAMPDTTK